MQYKELKVTLVEHPEGKGTPILPKATLLCDNQKFLVMIENDVVGFGRMKKLFHIENTTKDNLIRIIKNHKNEQDNETCCCILSFLSTSCCFAVMLTDDVSLWLKPGFDFVLDNGVECEINVDSLKGFRMTNSFLKII